MEYAKSPLVSIIIPCHNRSDFLRECLQSVIEQTHQQLEVIVVDDASQEDIASIVRSIRWPQEMRVQVLRSEVNGGPGASRELGRQRASGDFICYLDSDDLWHVDKVEVQLQALQNSPAAGMCYCSSAEFESLPLMGTEPLRKKSDQEFHEFLPTVLFGRPWDTSACMWRRRVTDLIGPWFPGWTWEDYEYDCRAGCHDIQIAFVPRVLCYYRRDSEGQHLSLASDGSRRVQERARSLLRMFDELQRHHKLGEPETHARIVSLLYSQVVSLLYSHEKDVAAESLRRIRRAYPIPSPIYLLSAVLQAALIVLPDTVTARAAARSRHFFFERGPSLCK